MGVNLALARIGSVINDLASAAISSQYGVKYAYIAGFGVCIASLIGMVSAYYMDVSAETRVRKNKGLPRLANQGRLWQLFCRCRQGRGSAAMAIDEASGKGKAASTLNPVFRISAMCSMTWPISAR